jgi:hypothetical protein
MGESNHIANAGVGEEWAKIAIYITVSESKHE